MWGNNVTVINRTSKPLEYMFDGRLYVLKPGENLGVVESLAGHAKSKFPVMGAEDPQDPLSVACLIGVKEWGDDCSPIEQTDAPERFNRQLFTNPVDRVVKAGPSRSWTRVTEGPARNHTEFSGGTGTGRDGGD